jgi:hypothetical protein
MDPFGFGAGLSNNAPGPKGLRNSGARPVGTRFRFEAVSMVRLAFEQWCALTEFGGVFEGDGSDLFAGELLWRDAGRIASLAEEAVEAGGRDDPEKK